jgi:alkyl hydroperoxide reductase subunit AhpC
MPSLEEKGKDFAVLHTQILGISVDSTWCHDAWANHLGLTYPLLSDIMHEVGKAYGVFNTERHIDARAVFLVDKSGTVRYKEVYAPGTLPDPEALLNEARKL